jgi:hypothetical protein
VGLEHHVIEKSIFLRVIGFGDFHRHLLKT